VEVSVISEERYEEFEGVDMMEGWLVWSILLGCGVVVAVVS
jgi:hypothetical protein